MTPTTSDAVFHEVLVVERDAQTTRVLLEAFARRGIRGTVAAEAAKATDYLDARRFDAVFVNLQTASTNGSPDLRLIRRIRADQPETPILVTSDVDRGDWAIETVRAGATEFYAKPLSAETVEQILAALLPCHTVKTLATLPAARGEVRKIIGSSRELFETVQRAAVVAPTSAPILIHGESGTGKELIARLVHCRSRRADGPFVKVNCAALTESLLESELFGHEKGAFTGACRQFRGRFEQAHGGTLLLDEITETPPSFQAKLLRVLEEMNFQRVGGAEEIDVNVRIVSTTNTDILREVQEGRFRADLYYRLAAIRLEVPPLRRRPQDVPTLIWHFINEFTKETRRPITAVDADSLEILRRYTWPGNVRQLRNMVWTAMIFGSGQVLSLTDAPWLLQELQPQTDAPPAADLAGVSLRELEREAILATLDAHEGNQSQAAKVLGISGRTLREKIKRYRQQTTRPGRITANS